GLGPRARRSPPGHTHLVHDRHVPGCLDQLGGELSLAEHPARHTPDLGCGHQWCLPPVSPDFTLERIITRLPAAPGTAPRSSNRCRSGSELTTSRFRTVTRSLPIWPAIRVPLNTRDGVAEAPMEPGERCLRSVPWEP